MAVKVLFVGRFQPPHKGHAHAIKSLQREHEVIIAVGSADQARTPQNPLSFGEREAMLKQLFNTEVIGIPDFFDAKKWSDYIHSKTQFDKVCSANLWTRSCFNTPTLIDPDLLEPTKYNSSVIRHKIKNNENWEELVPKEVADYINKNNLLQYFK